VATSWFSHVTPGLGVVIKSSSPGADVRSLARAGQRISAPLHVPRAGKSVRQFDPAAGGPRAARPPAQRANALVRVKYIVTIEGRGPPGHRVTQAWLGALAQSDANFETP
jgi:hypothetical protein